MNRSFKPRSSAKFNNQKKGNFSFDPLPSILKRFPFPELSYGHILHKKVYADYYIITPKGTKAFLWFTYENDGNVCYILQLGKHNKIIKAKKYSACFSDDLAYGTVIYGSFFEVNQQPYFTCENIYYYKGNKIDYYTYEDKLNIFSKIFNKYIRQIAYTPDFIYIGLPIIHTNIDAVINDWNKIAYTPYCIEFIRKNKNTPIGKYFIKPDEIQYDAIFNIKPRLSADTYEVYCSDNSNGNGNNGNNDNNEYYIGIAGITDYKTSVFMNTLFRNIKENSNLDLLEESDDEEEFQNVAIDKFVNLDKQIKMRCVYIDKFKAWKPVEVMDDNAILTNKSDIRCKY